MQVSPAIAPVSNGRAILVGTFWVNVPVLLIIAGGWSGLGASADALGAFSDSQLPAVSIATGFLVAVVPFTAGWLWWSFNIPKWRIWALERTNDWLSLEQDAIGAGLIWNGRTVLGRLFTRTEIWSRDDRRREADLRLKHRTSPGTL